MLFSKQTNQKTITISLITYYLTWKISEHLFVFKHDLKISTDINFEF